MKATMKVLVYWLIAMVVMIGSFELIERASVPGLKAEWARRYGPNGTHVTKPTPWPSPTPVPFTVVTPAPVEIERVSFSIPDDIDFDRLSPRCARALAALLMVSYEMDRHTERWDARFEKAKLACPQLVHRPCDANRLW